MRMKMKRLGGWLWIVGRIKNVHNRHSNIALKPAPLLTITQKCYIQQKKKEEKTKKRIKFNWKTKDLLFLVYDFWPPSHNTVYSRLYSLPGLPRSHSNNNNNNFLRDNSIFGLTPSIIIIIYHTVYCTHY